MNNAALLMQSALVLRPIAKDELVTGYIITRRHSGLEFLPNLIRNRYGKNYNSNYVSWLFPSNLTDISSVFGDFTGSAETLLLNNTVYPVLKRFITAQDAATLRQHYLHSSIRGIASKVGFSSMSTRGRRWKLAACRKCLDEDITADGHPFWRRDFVIPGVEYCAKHEEPLLTPCLYCNQDVLYSRAVSFPNMECECSHSKISHTKQAGSEETEKGIELAAAISRLLDTAYLPELGADLASRAIFSRATELGLVKSGLANPREILLFADAHDSAGAARGMYFGGLSLKRLYRIFTLRDSVRDATTAVRLLQELYGSWHEAQMALRQFGASQDFLQVPAPSRKTEVRQVSNRRPERQLTDTERYEIYLEFQSEYRALRQEYPSLPATTLALRLPHKARMALTREYLMQIGESVPPGCVGNEYYKVLDESLAAHIRARHRELMEHAAPPRISKALLLKGHKMASVWKSYEHRLSEAKKALAECQESDSDYRRRKLLALVIEGKVSSICADECDVVSLLEDTQVAALLKEVRGR